MRSYPQAGCDPVLIAVTTGTGGTATCRVTCTGAVRHGWLSQPGGGLGGSGGPAGDFAAGEADEAGVPRGDDGPGAVGDVAGPDGDLTPGRATSAVLPAAHDVTQGTARRTAASDASEYARGRRIETSVAQTAARHSAVRRPARQARPGHGGGGNSGDRRCQLKLDVVRVAKRKNIDPERRQCGDFPVRYAVRRTG